MSERGVRRPSIDTILVIAHTLGITPGRLIDDVDKLVGYPAG